MSPTNQWAARLTVITLTGALVGTQAEAQSREGRAPSLGDTLRAVSEETRLATRVGELETAVAELLRRQSRLADSLAKTRRQATDAMSSPAHLRLGRRQTSACASAATSRATAATSLTMRDRRRPRRSCCDAYARCGKQL